MMLQFTLAARYLAGRKLRTFLTTLAIIFGVLLVFGMNIVLPTMITALQANVQGAEGIVDFSITNTSGKSFPVDVTARVQNLPGIRAVSGSLERTINLPADFIDADPARPDRITVIKLVGITPEIARTVRAYPLVDGRFLQDSDSASALISQTLADALSVRLEGSFYVPSTAGTTELTVVGILPPRLGAGNEEVLVNLPQAQKMVAETGNINVIDLNVEAFAGETRRAEIQSEIEAALGGHYHVGTLLAGDELFATLQLGQIALNLFGVLAFFMGGFIILNTFRTLVSERRRDIGILRALGATRRTIIGIILTEGVLQGVIGSFVGLVLGYLLAFGILKLAQIPLSQFINIQLGVPVVPPLLWLVAVLLGVGVTVLAGLLPAYNASRVTPLEALRLTLAEVEFKRLTGWGFFTGVVIIILTLAALCSGQAAFIIPGGFLFLLGLVLVVPVFVHPFALVFGRIISLIQDRQGIGLLAQNNLTRQPSRVAVTVSASMLGLAVIVAAGGLVTSITGTIGEMIHKSLGSDYLFVPPSIGIWGGNIGADASLADGLRHVEGVEAVSTFRYAASMSAGQAVSLIGIEPLAFGQVSGLSFINGNESAYEDLTSGRFLIANGSFLAATGKKVGETVDLLTSDAAVQYRIVAAGSDLLNGKVTTAYISQSYMQTDFGSTEDVFIQLNLKKDANQEEVGKQIRALALKYPQFKLISGNDYYASIKAQLDTAFIAIYILFFILAIPSLIAMLNTLTISVIERTREIGMVRALGGTQKQIRAMVLVEALLLATIGTAFGIFGGLYLGYVFVTTIRVMFPMGYYFPFSGILAATAIGLLFGALAAFIPARQAARMNLVDALRYE